MSSRSSPAPLPAADNDLALPISRLSVATFEKVFVMMSFGRSIHSSGAPFSASGRAHRCHVVASSGSPTAVDAPRNTHWGCTRALGGNRAARSSPPGCLAGEGMGVAEFTHQRPANPPLKICRAQYGAARIPTGAMAISIGGRHGQRWVALVHDASQHVGAALIADSPAAAVAASRRNHGISDCRRGERGDGGGHRAKNQTRRTKDHQPGEKREARLLRKLSRPSTSSAPSTTRV